IFLEPSRDPARRKGRLAKSGAVFACPARAPAKEIIDMTRLFSFFSRCMPAGTLALVVAIACSSAARAADPQPAAGEKELPLSRVVLYSSGVGFYEHDAQIEG